MHPFSLNTPQPFNTTKLSTSFSNLPQLQNLQNFQRLQVFQNLQNQANQVLVKAIHSPQILSNSPSLSNSGSVLTYSNLFSRPSQGPLVECSNTIGLLQNAGGNHDLTNQITSLMLAWKVQNNIQSELYKNQLAQLLEMQKQLDLKMKENQSLFNKAASPQEQEISPVNKIETVAISQMKKTLKNQIKAMILFVLQNSGRISDSQIATEKDKYKDNSSLVAVFDELISKYASTIKTKEEMIKYTVRKAFKFIKNQVKKENRIDSKEASAYLCQRYFKDYTGTIPNLDDEEDFLKFVLPFRKNSKNKTMNSSFINEVFASHEFRVDYQGFLDDLDEILEIDNNAKLERFINFIEENLKKNKIPDIKKYKRIPWPQVWIVNTKKIAADLPDSGSHETVEETKKLIKRSSETTPNLSQNSEISESGTRGTVESSPSAH